MSKHFISRNCCVMERWKPAWGADPETCHPQRHQQRQALPLLLHSLTASRLPEQKGSSFPSDNQKQTFMLSNFQASCLFLAHDSAPQPLLSVSIEPGVFG